MKIKELLSDSSKWTIGFGVRNKKQVCVLPTDKDAVCWCLLGALVKCYYQKEILEIEYKIKRHLNS